MLKNFRADERVPGNCVVTERLMARPLCRTFTCLSERLAVKGNCVKLGTFGTGAAVQYCLTGGSEADIIIDH